MGHGSNDCLPCIEREWFLASHLTFMYQGDKGFIPHKISRCICWNTHLVIVVLDFFSKDIGAEYIFLQILLGTTGSNRNGPIFLLNLNRMERLLPDSNFIGFMPDEPCAKYGRRSQAYHPKVSTQGPV
ncbi:hypothetical protein CBL_06835 [Carabus blaptoides fortunei]